MIKQDQTAFQIDLNEVDRYVARGRMERSRAIVGMFKALFSQPAPLPKVVIKARTA